ncbi:transposase family protein [Glycomyces sp. YM15]|uniref:transposase family protein n=1 Tax=Glycomyces sp. YM15 TaxID=2800446 RepID=UPI0035ABD45B
MLRFLIDGTRIAQLAADNALGRTTAYDNLWEGLDVLAAIASSLAEAIDAARAAGDGHIGLDGTLVPTTHARVEGPTKGVNLFWIGKHLLVLVDLGYEKFRAFPAVVMGHKTPKGGILTEDQKEWNRLIGAKRALAEKANADVKTRFRCLQKVSLNPWRIGTIARAGLAFHRIERPRRLILTQRT